VSDYYPFGAMKQAGEVASLSNGGFEYYGSNGYPVGWSWSGQVAANKSWDANVFSVIDNPISAQVEGIGYAREGRAFLKLGSSYDATSEEVDVMPNTDYIITAYANTKNLKSGAAKIGIVNAAGAVNPVITQDLGHDWRFQMGRFNAGGQSRIKVKLYASATAASEGNFYYDDVKIRPALNSKDDWYTNQSCRLYPQSDSLSCDYYEDSGSRQKGWYGYCLEYDRAPGNPNACILWYPVDKVKGDGIEEGAGYLGKIPVYYCLEAKSLIPVEYRERLDVFTGCAADSDGQTCANTYAPNPPPGYKVVTGPGWVECGRHNGYYNCDWAPDGTMVKQINGENGWYITNGSLDTDKERENGIKFYDSFTGNLLDDAFAYCSKAVQTVTSVGDNKYWSSRVYEGSNWKILPFNYQYSTADAPFGSIAAPSSNPYDWDGNSADGIQPLLVKRSSSGEVSASNPYKIANPIIADSFYGVCSNSGNICFHINGVDSYDINKADCTSGEGTCQQVDFSGNPVNKLKLLFAKSYGSWSWDVTSSRYLADNSVSWNLPTSICTANPRASASDYCAIPPVVSNVKINNSAANVNLTKNGFINLTFNTKADSNQLPLVMYAVDWGDGESTTVTGVEMRDRPNPDTPHSLYHLYSYWDLKAKASSGVAGIDCSTAGECRVRPKVQIKDNWGWCNKGTAINVCGAGQWDNFGGLVVVKEK